MYDIVIGFPLVDRMLLAAVTQTEHPHVAEQACYFSRMVSLSMVDKIRIVFAEGIELLHSQSPFFTKQFFKKCVCIALKFVLILNNFVC